jgi:hypothetical protein
MNIDCLRTGLVIVSATAVQQQPRHHSHSHKVRTLAARRASPISPFRSSIRRRTLPNVNGHSDPLHCLAVHLAALKASAARPAPSPDTTLCIVARKSARHTTASRGRKTTEKKFHPFVHDRSTRFDRFERHPPRSQLCIGFLSSRPFALRP